MQEKIPSIFYINWWMHEIQEADYSPTFSRYNYKDTAENFPACLSWNIRKELSNPVYGSRRVSREPLTFQKKTFVLKKK